MKNKLLFLGSALTSLGLAILLPQMAWAGWFENARAYFLAKQYSNAAPCFEKAMQENPANHRALVYDAACYDRLGQTERARALYQLVIAVFPTSESANVARRGLSGLLAPAAAKTPAAAPAAAASAAAACKEPEGRSNDAMCAEKLAAAKGFHERGKFSEAENNFADALRYAEKGGQLNAQLAEVLQAEGDYFVDRRDYTKAYPFYKRELALRESLYGRDSRKVLDCLIRIAPTYAQNGELDTADQMYRRCMPVFQKDYDNAVNAHKRLTTERNALIGCMTGLVGVLRQTRGRHQSTTRDEYDELSDQLKLLNEEASKPAQ
jgi:tetratricopeptide (TPR) repeat protein